MDHESRIHIGFLIFEGFPMACLTSMIEPLRAANEIANQPAFAWTLIGEKKGRVMSSAQVAFEATQSLAEADDLDSLFLLSSPTERFADTQKSPAALRSLARHGVTLGSISGGVFPLVRAGIVRRQPVSVHWCYEAAFRAEFPDVDARSDVIVASARLQTVSGAAAAFDLALRLVEGQLGRETAHEVACWFQHPSMRGEGVRQKVPVAQAPHTGDDLPDLVLRAVDIFASRISDAVTVAEVARKTGVTPRQIERAFKAATGQSPTHYYRAMRMKAARQLVIYSGDAIADIAAAVGYGSSVPLVSHYKAAFGVTPQRDRRRANQFRVDANKPVPSI
ncbi:GlxA family transcriptional regulator [Roseobacter sp. EG26]|uniref:GlxA family transcriptional regulator n=1 Tax=Roseobacter sp. EG26 TaxID=3412477 RepID=UPI003CE4554C